MRPADLDAVTIDAYGTLVELADPVPALTEGLRALGVECDADTVKQAFAKEVAYYRGRSHEGRDDATHPEAIGQCRRTSERAGAENRGRRV